MKQPRSWIARVTTLAVLAAPAFPFDQGSETLVQGRKAQGVRFAKRPWRAVGDALVPLGDGEAIESENHLGVGGFAVRIEVSGPRLVGSGLQVALGRSRVVLGAGPDAADWRVEGPLFPGRAQVVPGTADALGGSGRHVVELRRAGDRFTLLVDERQVFERKVPDEFVGAVGIDPGRSQVRLHQWVVSGNLLTPEHLSTSQVRRIQPEIDRAIERGAAWLLRHQLRDGSWSHHAQWYRTGGTALCTYTLLKAGVPPAHPAVQRALAWLAVQTPGEVYSLGCEMMAWQATHDRASHARLKELLQRLSGWQAGGSWGYPGNPPGDANRDSMAWRDLSNTQYAALGLRAAALEGLKVPQKTWLDLVDATLDYQGREEEVLLATEPGRTGTGRAPAAGFHYKPREGNATGSMTAAGVGTLLICREGLGDRIPNAARERLDRAVLLGTNWLRHHFSVDQNPGNPGWLTYYLYGLERVGSLLGTELLGPHAWYFEGAKKLLKDQRDDGSWSNDQTDTCFAILFLKRATALQAVTGPDEAKRAPTIRTAESDQDAVRLRGTGVSPLTLFVTGFRDEVRQQLGGEVRVERVEYLVDGRTVAEVRADPSRPWQGEQFAVQHVFERGGTYRLTVRAHLRSSDPNQREPIVVGGPGFELVVDEILEPWMEAAATAPRDNLLADVEVTAIGSTERSDGERAVLAADRRQDTRWVSAPGDRTPRLRLAFDPPVRAQVVVIGQAAASPAERPFWTPIQRARVVVNGARDAHVVTFDEDPLRPAVLTLDKPQRIRSLDVTVESTWREGDRIGIAEVELRRAAR